MGDERGRSRKPPLTHRCRAAQQHALERSDESQALVPHAGCDSLAQAAQAATRVAMGAR